ncbi:MAG: tRNA (guanosine(46)-N7)-methyltransferase TrmB [Synergistaceae bacterium]|nr:tRNA (guanosine(46)-N7)-methyltransferase TrmB [Synergistaceae bacterium]
MDILALATTQARPQYKVIITPESGKFLPVSTKTELEIGFGNGEFTVQYAMNNPEILLYGVEISQACVLRCARRAYGLDNLRLVNTDARYMLRELFPDESLQKIMMHFPCPWSKNADAHKRVTAKDFADGLAAVLKVSGTFVMVTDDEPYAREVWDVLGQHEALAAEDFTVNPKREITTKYERKWLAEGRSIYRVTFRKSGAFTAERRVTGGDMHIRIPREVTAADMAGLRNTEGRGGWGKSFWKFGRTFSEADGDTYLLETLTSDDEYEQKFYIHVAPKDDGYLLRLDKTTLAFLTPAVRSALSDAAERLSRP